MSEAAACALELEIESAYCSLAKAKDARTIYLTRDNYLRWGQSMRSSHATEVGTYGRSITLADFREDVFFAAEHRGNGYG